MITPASLPGISAKAGGRPGDGILQMRDIRMRFGENEVLKGITLELRRAEVFGLLGQNGSGKSTLIKVLAGFNSPERGSAIRLWGRDLALPVDAAEMKRRGVAFVHQHLGLIPSLTVIENMAVGSARMGRGLAVNWRREGRRVAALFTDFGLTIDPFADVATLSPVERAFVAIVRAFDDLRASDAGHGGEGILVLDEPTPFLPAGDVDKLFALIRSIKDKGASVVIVTHDIDEVRAICDRVAILRDGELVRILDIGTASRQEILDTIVGRAIAPYRRAPRALDRAAPTVRVQGLAGGALAGFDIDIAAGETIGLTGLIGSGFADIPYLLYGARRGRGRIAMSERIVDVATLDPAAAQAMGLALLPGDRLGQAGIGSLPVEDNITFPSLRDVGSLFGLDTGALRRLAGDLVRRHDVRPADASLDLGKLSGGNQQKVLLAKWLQRRPKLLMLDEPTQGVDFGARQQIFAALDEAARGGTAVLCASTDADQLAQICDRVVVFSRGGSVAVLSGSRLTKEAITETCFHAQEAIPDPLRDVPYPQGIRIHQCFD